MEYFLLDDGKKVDVFTGKGWGNWTRFEVTRSNGKAFLKKVAGQPMSNEDFKALCEALR